MAKVGNQIPYTTTLRQNGYIAVNKSDHIAVGMKDYIVVNKSDYIAVSMSDYIALNMSDYIASDYIAVSMSDYIACFTSLLLLHRHMPFLLNSDPRSKSTASCSQHQACGAGTLLK